MTSRKVADKMTAAELTPKMLELRRYGLSIAKIASQVGKSKSYVHKHITKALDELADKLTEETKTYRAIQLMRYEGLLTPLQSKIVKGEPPAIDTARRILDSINKITGVETPQKVAPTTPDGTEPYSDPAAAMTEDERLKRIAELQKKLDDGK